MYNIILFCSTYVALFERVRKQHSALIEGLKLDGSLLAKLNERKLLTRTEFSDINAKILGHNIPAAGEYFVNSVMFRWSPQVFEGNVCLLIEALLSHDDTGNQRAATDLCECFSECGLDVPHVEDARTMP